MEMTVNISKPKRPFPNGSEHLLPLRTCFMDYKKDRSRALVSGQNKETSMNKTEASPCTRPPVRSASSGTRTPSRRGTRT